MKPRNFFTTCSIILFFGVFAMNCASKDVGKIHGLVVDATPNLSQKNFSSLDEAVEGKLKEEFLQTLREMYKATSPVPNAIVTARGGSVTNRTTTDAEGRFKFAGLPVGAYDLPSEGYELTAEVPTDARTGKRRAMTVKPVRIYRVLSSSTNTVTLRVRGDLVAVRGRITDPEGRPVANAKICGEAFPMPESAEATPPTRYAISGTDGSYELGGFCPDSIYKIAGYLNGGDPTQSGQSPFYVKVYAEADGYVQDKATAPKVPLVTEELLAPARHLLKLFNKASKEAGTDFKFTEKENVVLPASHGNTIVGVDVILTKK